MFDWDDEGGGGGEGLVADFEIGGGVVGGDLVAVEEGFEGGEAGGIAGGGEGVGLGFGGGGFFEGVEVEGLLVGEEFGAEGVRGFEGGEGGDELVADGEGEGEEAVFGVGVEAAGAGLLKEDADGAVDVGVGGAFADVVVVIGFAGVVEGADGVEGFGVFLRHLFGEGLVGLWGEGVDHFGDAGLEEVGAVDVAHFVVVGDDVGLPVVEEFEAALGLGVDGGEPVAVEVEPVVVGAAIGPAFLVLAITAVGAGVLAAVAVGP